jgi:hypothetical protein
LESGGTILVTDVNGITVEAELDYKTKAMKSSIGVLVG